MKQIPPYKSIPSFNLISKEYLANAPISKIGLLIICLSIVIIGEIVFIPTIYQKKSSLQLAYNDAQTKSQQINQKIDLLNATREKAQSILNAIDNSKKEHDIREGQLKDLSVKQSYLPPVVAKFFQTGPPDIVLSLLDIKDTEINATGIANNYSTLNDYRLSILDQPDISRITSFQSTTGETFISFSFVAKIKGREE